MESAQPPRHQLRPLGPRSLFNLTQDDKHLVVLDLRPRHRFLDGFLRKAYNFDPLSKDVTEDELLVAFTRKMDELAAVNEAKYGQPRLRRVAVIWDSTDPNAAAVKAEIEHSKLLDTFDQKFLMADSFQKFQSKYPFLVFAVPSEMRDRPLSAVQEFLMEHRRDDLLFANASFPLEVVEDALYLGRHFHADNKRLCEVLGVGAVVEVRKKEKGSGVLTPDPSKPSHFLLELDLDAFLDLDSILESVIQKGEGTRLLLVGDSLDLTTGLAIGYLMKKAKKSLNHAAMVVFAGMNSTSVDRLFFNQLMNYEPGKITFVKM